MRILLTLVLSIIVFSVNAQYSLTGRVTAAESSMRGATIQLLNTNYKTATDQDGQFRFRGLQPGTYELQVSYVGYATVVQRVELNRDLIVNVSIEPSTIMAEEVIVSATRATREAPFTYKTIEKKELEERNLGQDVPYILQYTPSLVSTSDAGTGIGYTGMRIRGTDASRINVTINGIPLNDAESQQVFWVNLPDFTSTTDDIQIQRGVGTSTNGGSAFGATVNLQTSKLNRDPFVGISTSAGSFGTWKGTLQLNTGLIKDHWAFEGRLSRIQSDGYIDRARADLNSYYLSGGYYGKKTIVKAVVFSGNEVTYQAWYGVPEDSLQTNRTYNPAGEYVDENGELQYYDNQVDDYGQDHYQLHFSHQFNNQWSTQIALHYTKGAGFFEEYAASDAFANYGLQPSLIQNGDTLTSGDFIRRKWLDNDFYGTVFSVNLDKRNYALTIGGGFNRYKGDHFGEILWSDQGSNLRFIENNSPLFPEDRYYESDAVKNDFNAYAKLDYRFDFGLSVFGDLQIRTVNYETMGINTDLRPIDVDENFVFFNPKFGATYTVNDRTQVYGSFAIGNREPDRVDFVEATNGAPEHETLRNFELGIRRGGTRSAVNVNYYMMDYKNQLVLTGELNDVGTPIRTNAARSYRTGVELDGFVEIVPKLSLAGNITFSSNRIRNFVEQVDVFDQDFNWIGRDTIDHGNTDIAYSPDFILGANLDYQPVKGLHLKFLAKYVGEQFLNNTSDQNARLDDYFVGDVLATYSFSSKLFKEFEIRLLVNNVFNATYESNGWNYAFISEGQRGNINGFYPQAGTNFLAGISLKI